MFFLTQTPTAATVFERVVSLEKAHPAQSMVITCDSRVSGKVTHTEYDLAVQRPYRLKLRIREKGTTPSDRIYFIAGDKLEAYEPSTNEYLVRKVSGATLDKKLESGIGTIDPLALLSTDPSVAQAYFQQFSPPTGWTLNHVGKTLVLSRNVSFGGKAGLINMSFHDNTMQPIYISFAQSRGGHVDWHYSDGLTPQSVSFSHPASAKKVDAFHIRPAQPHYQSAAAGKVVRASLAAYERLRSLNFTVAAEGDVSHITWSGRQARQDSGRLIWAYDGSVLSVLDKANRKLYRGTTHGGRINDYLGRLGGRIDPTLRVLMSGRNPLELLFIKGMTARLAGAIMLNGAQLDLVELRSPGIRIQLQVRRDNHLLAATLTENIDPAGHSVSKSQKLFTYGGSSGAFRLGGNALPLPR
jgi:hypothetical protein